MKNKTYDYDQVDALLPEHHEWDPRHGPLTKREYFASAIFSGLLSGVNGLGFDDTQKQYAQIAVSMADHLIEALNKNESPEVF